MINISIAQVGDIEAINALLQENNLPFSDTRESKIDFLIARNSGELVGCIGMETFGADGLLRSFAVKESFRNQALGKELYLHLLKYATDTNVETLHLLTNTAKDYFLRKAFVVADRKSAPGSVQQSREFSSLCPASSTYMVLEKIATYVQ